MFSNAEKFVDIITFDNKQGKARKNKFGATFVRDSQHERTNIEDHARDTITRWTDQQDLQGQIAPHLAPPAM